MSIKGTITVKRDGQVVDYFPRTSYENVIDEETQDSLKTDMTKLKAFQVATYNKLIGIADFATKTDKSSINGNIIINGNETVVYTHPTNVGNKHIPAGGSAGQILRWASDGTAVWGADNNTTYNVATPSANGLMSSTDKSKLDGIEENANNYTHPTSSGNKHIPAGGSSGQILKWSASGTAVWSTEKVYDLATTSTDGLMSSTDKSKLDSIASGANKYTHPTGDGNLHVPANGTSNNGKYLQATATAGTYQWASLPTASTSIAGIVQLNDATNSTSTTTAATANAVKKAYDLANSKAPASHGNHVPATQSANNAVFLRNDNTWQTVTPANIGAISQPENVTGMSIDINTYNLSSGSPKKLFLVETSTGGATNISNIPVNEPFTLDIESIRWASSTDYITKQTFVSATTKATYERWCTNGTWSSWLNTARMTTTPTSGQVLVADGVTGGIKTSGFTIAKSVPSNAVFTDTTYSVATTGANGLMSSADKTKLDGIAAGATKYTHPTGDGNLHVPANGTGNSGKFLQATSTAGTYQWAAIPSATTSAAGIVQLNDATNSTSTTTAATANAVKKAYDLANSKASTTVASTSANGLMSSTDKAKLDGIATGATKYVHPTGDGNNHVPANGTGNSGKFLQATGTAGTYQWAAIPSATTSAAGVVQLNDAINSTSTTTAATANAVKKAYDLAATKASTSVATTGANGLMSSTDKAKLDGIAAGANNYVHPGSGTNPHGTTKSDVGLGSVNNWGASSSIGANSTTEYATTNMVAQVRAEKSNVGHTHNYLPLGGGQLTGSILMGSAYSGTGIHLGNGDGASIGTVNGTTTNGIGNLIIQSWYGVGFSNSCSAGGPVGVNLAIDCRTGSIIARGNVNAAKVYNAVWNDYAEWFEREDLDEKIEPGDIVAWNDSGVVKACEEFSNVVGIYSDTYGHIVGGERLENMEDNIKKFVPIGLNGRVSVKVIGKVKKGQFITYSNIPGVGIAIDRKDYIPGTIVGKAIENKSDEGVNRVKVLILNM